MQKYFDKWRAGGEIETSSSLGRSMPSPPSQWPTPSQLADVLIDRIDRGEHTVNYGYGGGSIWDMN